jgi:hypothetical protein
LSAAKNVQSAGTKNRNQKACAEKNKNKRRKTAGMGYLTVNGKKKRYRLSPS